MCDPGIVGTPQAVEPCRKNRRIARRSPLFPETARASAAHEPVISQLTCSFLPDPPQMAMLCAEVDLTDPDPLSKLKALV
jgi:hypothetical protein